MVSLKQFASVSCMAFGFSLGLTYWDVSQISSTMNSEQFQEAMIVSLFSSKIRVISVLMMAFSLLLIAGKIIQLLFFGSLRGEESRKIHDRVLNYILFKIVFSGIILDLIGWEEVLPCILWFTVLGFFKVFTLLCAERLAYLLTMADRQASKHIRLLTLSIIILAANIQWFFMSFILFDTTYDVLLILNFECIIVLMDSIQNLVKYTTMVGLAEKISWEKQNRILYYSDFFTETISLAVTIIHYLHLWYMHGISCTLVDAVLFLNLRKVFNRLREKINAYYTYQKLVKTLHSVFPTVGTAEFESGEYDDTCLICRDQMSTGKKLPCNHVFHESCILSWLEKQNNCPTCREVLINPVNEQANNPPARLMNWFPRGIEAHPFQVTPDMIAAVREVAPHVPEHIIAADLAATGSANLTISNIFEGRIDIPEPVPEPQHNHAPPAEPIRRTNSPSISSLSSFENTDLGSLTEEIEKLERSLLPVPSGFASSASERHNLLEQRKEAMKQQSRLKYLKKLQEKKQKEQEEKKEVTKNIIIEDNTEDTKEIEEIIVESKSDINLSKSNTDDTSFIPFSLQDSAEVRRRRAIEAAEKRRKASVISSENNESS